MDRKQRHASRHRLKPVSTGDHDGTARLIEAMMRQAGMTGTDRDQFVKWAFDSMIQTYKEHRMDTRITLENEVRSLGLRFPNGTVDKPYSTTFELPVDKISDITIEDDNDLGLQLTVGEEGKCTLAGTPGKSGDFTLRLRFNTVPGEPASELRLPIAFNPNPRSLWKDIPSDQTGDPYAKPDSASEYVKVEAGADGTPRKDIVAASQRGRSHAQEGRPRDDHFSLFHCPDSDWYIIAVADGAGSAKYSRKGSQTACETVTSHCKEHLLDNPDFETAIRDYAADRDNKEKRTEVTRHVIDIIYKGAVKAHEAIKQEAAAKEDAVLKDYATTLMFAVCKKYDFGWFLASFWVGDGAMCLYDAETKSAKLLGTPDEGEFSGQTRFLTMPEIFRDPEVVSKRLRMTIVDDFTALMLMSDGVSDPMFETEKNLNDYGRWDEFMVKLRCGFPDDGIGGVDLSDDNEDARRQLLRWLDFWSPGNHDDRTIAILY